MSGSSKAIVGVMVSALAVLWVGCSKEDTCSYAGKNYNSGASFPSTDGCNTCTCEASRGIDCTLAACLGDAGYSPPGACTLPTAVTFGAAGGMVLYEDQYKLDPTLGLNITRNYNGRGSSGMDGATIRTCTPTLPACGASAVVSVSTVVADLATADVQAAFALGTTPIATPVFGVDERPVDGTIWSITLDSGGSVLVGVTCPSPTTSSCRPTPAGVQKLADDLQSLASAMSIQSACAGL